MKDCSSSLPDPRNLRVTRPKRREGRREYEPEGIFDAHRTRVKCGRISRQFPPFEALCRAITACSAGELGGGAGPIPIIARYHPYVLLLSCLPSDPGS